MEIGRKQYSQVLRHAFEKHYRERTDEWTRDPAMRVFPALVQGYLKLPENVSVLDIGCGSGADVDYLARVFARVTGLDLYRHDDWRRIEARCPNVTFYATTFLSFSGDAPFDLILDNGCLHHQHPEEYGPYLNRIAALLRHDGCLALSTFKNDHQDEFIDANGRLHRYFNDEELHQLLALAGFDILHEDDIYRITKGDYYRISYVQRIR